MKNAIKKKTVVIQKHTISKDNLSFTFRFENSKDFIIYRKGLLKNEVIYSSGYFKFKCFIKQILFSVNKNVNIKFKFNAKKEINLKLINKHIEDIFVGLEALNIVEQSMFYNKSDDLRLRFESNFPGKELLHLNKSKFLKYLTKAYTIDR